MSAAAGRIRFLFPTLCCGLALAAAPGLRAQTAAPASYYEFGTVVSEGQRTLDLQTFDPQRQRVVQHTFSITRDTRADAVHVGDSVEVIYGETAGERMLRRMILLPSGVPIAGPGPEPGASLTGSLPPPGAVAGGTPATAPTARDSKPAGTVPAVQPVTIPKGTRAAARSATPTSRSQPPTGKPGTATKPGTPVALGSNLQPAVPKVNSVTLGAAPGAGGPPVPTARNIRQAQPAEECNRSTAGWPAEPVRIAVIDFRYPTEREEAHDVGTTGGGSGTAIADLVFARMEALEQTDARFAFSRGDRKRLDRSDFAGAARLGRQLGVDAVLAGTFFPVSAPASSGDTGTPPPVVTYELRAGLVDTCTGQLLMRLSSVACPQALSPGLDPGVTGEGIAPCRRFAVPAADASDPRRYAAAFNPLLEAMLYPLEHNGTPVQGGRPEPGSAGLVTAVEGTKISLRLPAGVRLRAGEQVAVHAWRLAKSPATYTLHNLQDEEIGRVTLTRVEGAIATGEYMGDYPPLPGDPADLLP